MSGLDNKGTSFPHGINVPAGKFFVDGVAVNVSGVTAVANVAAANAATAAGANPTKAEYDVAVTELNECKSKLNSLLTNLRAAGILLP